MAATDGLCVLNAELKVVLYNGGGIEEEVDGIAPVFDDWSDINMYHETMPGAGYDVLLEKRDPTTVMAITHAVVLGPQGCSAPLLEMGVFAVDATEAGESIDPHSARSATYREHGAEAAGDEFAFEVHTAPPKFNGVAAAACPVPFGLLHICLRSCRVISDSVPYVNIDLGSIVLIGYKGAEAVAAAIAAGAVPSHLPQSLGIPDCVPFNSAGVLNNCAMELYSALTLWPALVHLTSEQGIATAEAIATRSAMEEAAPRLSKGLPDTEHVYALMLEGCTPKTVAVAAEGLCKAVAERGPLCIANDIAADVRLINTRIDDDDDDAEAEEPDFEFLTEDEVERRLAAESGVLLPGADQPAAGGALPETGATHVAAASASAASSGGAGSQSGGVGGGTGGKPAPSMEDMVRAAMARNHRKQLQIPMTASAALGSLLVRCKLDGAEPGESGAARRARQSCPLSSIYYLDPRPGISLTDPSGASQCLARFRLCDWRAAGSPGPGTMLALRDMVVEDYTGPHSLPARDAPPTAAELEAFVAAAQAGSVPEMLTGVPVTKEEAEALARGEELPPRTPDTVALLARERECREASSGLRWLGSAEAVAAAADAAEAGRVLVVVAISGLKFDVGVVTAAAVFQAACHQSGLPIDVVVLPYRSSDTWVRMMPKGDDDDVRVFLPADARDAVAAKAAGGGWAAVPASVGVGYRRHWELALPSVGLMEWQAATGVKSDGTGGAADAGMSLDGAEEATAIAHTASGAGGSAGFGALPAEDELGAMFNAAGAAAGDGDGEGGGPGFGDITASLLGHFVAHAVNRSGLVRASAAGARPDPKVASASPSLTVPASAAGGEVDEPALVIHAGSLVERLAAVEVTVKAAGEMLSQADGATEMGETMGRQSQAEFVALKGAMDAAKAVVYLHKVVAPGGLEALNRALETLETTMRAVSKLLGGIEQWRVSNLAAAAQFKALAMAVAADGPGAAVAVLVHRDNDADSLLAFNTCAVDMEGMGEFAAISQKCLANLADVGVTEDQLPCVVVLTDTDPTVLAGVDAEAIHAAFAAKMFA